MSPAPTQNQPSISTCRGACDWCRKPLFFPLTDRGSITTCPHCGRRTWLIGQPVGRALRDRASDLIRWIGIAILLGPPIFLLSWVAYGRSAAIRLVIVCGLIAFLALGNRRRPVRNSPR